MKLDLYNKKRNFKKTPEPKGKISKGDKHLYVIQKHAASHLHYDFRLELNGVLLSWAVPKGPCLDPTVKRLAVHVEDHPIEYGHFEGTIPKGEYGAGTVMLWDEGIWIPEDDNPTDAYHQGHLRFQLKAKKLNGRWSLIRFKRGEDKSWFLIKKDDEYARSLNEYDITVEEPNSVKTHYSLDEIADRKKKDDPAALQAEMDLPESVMPSEISPQLATLVDNIPSDDEWLHEMKFDGYRIIAFKQDNTIRLMSRNNKDWTRHFENLIKPIQALPAKNAIFDGEVVLLDDEQRPNFQLLQNAIDSGRDESFIYYIFDILYYEKYNLMSLPLIERKNILSSILSSSESSTIRYSDHIIGSGPNVFKKLCEMKLEGIVSKNIHSHYEEKRTKTWLKAKCLQRQEFVIGGYSQPKRSRQYFGSLYLGYFDENKNFIYCGNVGTGFNQVSLKEIYNALQKIKISHNPFHTIPPGVTTATWVEPKLVVEIEFLEWTDEGMLRQPSFKGMRLDKSAYSIRRENKTSLESIKSSVKKTLHKTNPLPYKLTNPDKILYPEDKITKLDLVTYYEKIQDWILPYIINRPLTLLRCPNNYKECFYQKHINESMPDSLYGIVISEKGKDEEHIYIKDWSGLMALIQMGTLEIHAWGSKITDVEFPDMITIDLDPAPDVEWQQVVSTAKIVKEHLASFKLKSFIKTTGGKGLHVVIPIKPEYDWKQVKNFAHVFSQFLAKRYPGDYISEMSKFKRKGKIFIDYLRNQRGATAISPYSTRARQGAPVSVPLHWDELTDNFDDTYYTIMTLPDRLKNLTKDPWEDFFKIKQSLHLDQFMDR